MNCISPHSGKTGKKREGTCNAETMPNGFGRTYKVLCEAGKSVGEVKTQKTDYHKN